MAVGAGNGNGQVRAECYRFGTILVDASAHALSRDGQPVPVEPKAFAVLLVLLRHAGELVRHGELLDEVWGHRHVTPGVLTRAIAQLRQALGDDPHDPCWIQTRHGLGYCFVGALDAQPERRRTPVAADAADASPGPASASATSGMSPATEGGATAMQAPPPPAALPTPVPASPQPAGTGERRVLAPDRRAATPGRRRGRWPLAVAVVLGVVLAGLLLWNLRDRAPLLTPSIAVLPFSVLDGGRDDRYLAEGLARELHDALSGVHGLEVAAWQSPAEVAREDPRATGRRLGVATVLDGDVRLEGGRLRIHTRLTDAGSGETLWSRVYERDMARVFETQHEIAQEVVRRLVGALPDTGEGLRRRLAPTRSLPAFDAYLRGMQQLLLHGGDRERQAAAYFRQALAHDQGFARAQAGLCRVELWRFEAHRDANRFESARLACLRAENMDPTMGEVVLALGDLYRVQGEYERADEYYRRIEDDPALRAQALIGRARVAAAQGRATLADAYLARAVEAAPSDADVHAHQGYQHYSAGRLSEAIASLARAAALRPGDAYILSTYGGMLLTAGRNREAEAVLERSLAIEPTEATLSNLGTLKYQRGDYAGAAALYRQATTLNPGHFQIWGNLGDALLADPATRAQARDAFREAAMLAERYVVLRAGDARALAALGWYRANLGATEVALDLVRRSEALGTEPAEVAYYNAETFALLGRRDEARRRIEAARRAGLAEVRITTTPILADVLADDSRTTGR